ncbi:hypothetical protein B1R32_11625 [Abditibacterium utsteinense]|uniref:Uncharacterized protein n=1 Tax=Abditibacterium utsteinense TaxID=1960156 RepID=A0A2S8SQI5_9BACT|nr:hypothetical protein B1R32_11625 [Abditibacterium utsteinense]
MKKSSKKSLEKRGILIAGRAQNASGVQVHADKRRPPRNLEKQRLKLQVQHETARNRGPFHFLWNSRYFTAVAVTSLPFRRPYSGWNRELKSRRRRRWVLILRGAAHRRDSPEPRLSFRLFPCRAA